MQKVRNDRTGCVQALVSAGRLYPCLELRWNHWCVSGTTMTEQNYLAQAESSAIVFKFIQEIRKDCSLLQSNTDVQVVTPYPIQISSSKLGL